MDEGFEITRAAVEVQRKPPKTVEDLEVERATSLSNAFNFLNKMWIGVSFVHMAMIMLLFTAHGTGLVWLVTTAAALVMVLGIDLALMRLSVYITIQREYRQPVGFWAWIVFLVSLAVEWTFNTGALWANMPGPEKLPPALSKTIAVTFGTFVALIIYVSATIPTRLARTAIVIREQARREREAEEEKQRNRDEARRKQQEAEERQRERERLATMPKVTDVSFVPLESHNEQLPPPTATMPRIGNGKAPFATNDLPAIIRVLYDKRIQRFKSVAELAELVGWSAPSSGATALANLQKAGVVGQKTENGYKINWRVAQPLMAPAANE
jgi:hypothetical protein